MDSNQFARTRLTFGKDKVDVAQERIRDINPDCKVTKWKTFFMPDTADQFDFSKYDYIVDCIDTVKGKLEIIARAKALNKPVISCKGAPKKQTPGSNAFVPPAAGMMIAAEVVKDLTQFHVTDLFRE